MKEVVLFLQGVGGGGVEKNYFFMWGAAAEVMYCKNCSPPVLVGGKLENLHFRNHCEMGVYIGGICGQKKNKEFLCTKSDKSPVKG